MSLSLDSALSATKAELFDGALAPALLRIVTDTRTIERGDTFLALRGENFDGHAYVAQAIAKGAAAVIIDDPQARVPGTATLLVPDTLRAYMALAGAARAAFRGSVLAITGSTGKTTTKVLAAQLLAARFGERVLASPANENNEIGVSKLLLAASNEEHDVLVVEMGARNYGDIAALVAIARPHVGILTNVGEAHLEIMGSRERLAETKWAIFGEGARAVLNLDDAVARERASSLPRDAHWFAALDTDAALEFPGRSTTLVGRTLLRERDGQRVRDYDIDVLLPGKHNRYNLAAALAAACELGVEVEAMLPLVPGLHLPPGRFESVLLRNGVRVIYDAYNANASGMMAALDAFAQEPGATHIAVLASMAELGSEAPALHERVGAHAAAANVDWLLAGGEYAQELVRGARDAGLSWERIATFATNDDAVRWLRERSRTGDVVLLKGSRKYKLEEVLQGLQV
ncbi:MAG TPA: UDP-N-acetylmuramoyl-tripeptide--D-alanyl-D-alanine ligase [Candidatus Dormibacteraeota bacterium]|nr:UDP-N-acetylmuramoyl-tripeptide--D-alanyl-D-alanine ligase [Candidatus Dormibacteraeota bacterium]